MTLQHNEYRGMGHFAGGGPAPHGPDGWTFGTNRPERTCRGDCRTCPARMALGRAVVGSEWVEAGFQHSAKEV